MANVRTNPAALRGRSGVVAGCAVFREAGWFHGLRNCLFTDGGVKMRLSLTRRNLIGLLALAGAGLVLTASVALADCYLVWVCIGNVCAWILVCI